MPLLVCDLGLITSVEVLDVIHSVGFVHWSRPSIWAWTGRGIFAKALSSWGGGGVVDSMRM